MRATVVLVIWEESVFTQMKITNAFLLTLPDQVPRPSSLLQPSQQRGPDLAPGWVTGTTVPTVGTSQVRPRPLDAQRPLQPCHPAAAAGDLAF